MKRLIIGCIIIIGCVLCMSACSQADVQPQENEVLSESSVTNFSMNEVNDSKEEAKEVEEVTQKNNNNENKQLESEIEEYSSAEHYMSHVYDVDDPSIDIYDEAHGYTDDIPDDEPEGADTYEVGETVPRNRMNISNINEMSNVYNDYQNCELLRRALLAYFDYYTEELDYGYHVALVDNTCVLDEISGILSFEATVESYPGVVLYIEYDINERKFGIDSDLMDASLAVQRENSKE